MESGQFFQYYQKVHRMEKVDLHPGFLWFLALLCWLDTMGLFWWILLAVLLHELGHLLIIWLLGAKLQSIRLRFCDIRIDTAPLSYMQEMIAAMGGPTVNLLCFLVFRQIRSDFSAVSLLLGLFNLLPIIPLDGGRFLYASLHLFLPPKTADLCCESVSLFLIVCLLALALTAIFYWKAGLWPLLCILLLFARLALEIDEEIS